MTQKIMIGKPIPIINNPATNGQLISFPNFRGKNIVVYFYPKDNTPGCTMEGKDFRDAYPKFQALDTEIFGVSRDSLPSHEKFKEKCHFPFELISDPNGELCELFDVIRMKSLFGKQYKGIERSTFLIDKQGILRQEWRKIKIRHHVRAVLDAVQALSS